MINDIVDRLDPKRAGADVEDVRCARSDLLDDPTSDLNKNERLSYRRYRFEKIIQHARIFSRSRYSTKKLVYCVINKANLAGNKDRGLAQICAKHEMLLKVTTAGDIEMKTDFFHLALDKMVQGPRCMHGNNPNIAVTDRKMV